VWRRFLSAGRGQSGRGEGGGGYGDPLDRDSEAVQQDVYDRRVTVLMAREHYGVGLQKPGLSVDQDAT